MLGTLGRIEGMCRKNTRYDAPDLAIFVDNKICSILGIDDARHLPHPVITVCGRIALEFLVAMQRNGVHVVHDLLWMREHVAVHALQYKLHLCERIAKYGFTFRLILSILISFSQNRDSWSSSLSS